MRYKASVFSAAEAMLKKRRDTAEKLAKLRRNEVSTKYPELDMIENEMKNAALEVIRGIGGAGSAVTVKELAKRNLEAQAERRALLKAAGYDEDYLEPPYTCKKCNDSGFVDGKMCDCHKALLKQLSLSDFMKTAIFTSSTFGTFDLSYFSKKKDPEIGCSPYAYMSETYNMLKEYAETFSSNSPSFLFCGATGLGKTHLSLAVMNTLLENGHTVYYSTAGRLLGQLEKEHFGKSDADTEEEIRESELLIIDDLGTEFKNTFSASAVYELINSSLLQGQPMIISTNLTMGELEERYGERVASRLNAFEIVNFCGTDVRQLKK